MKKIIKINFKQRPQVNAGHYKWLEQWIKCNFELMLNGKIYSKEHTPFDETGYADYYSTDGDCLYDDFQLR